MRILVIDDERTFNHHKVVDFLGLEYQDAILYSRNLDDATNRLYNDESTVPNVIFLDHDLGNGEDVRTLTRLIEREAYSGTLFPVDKFVIHSMNPIGRKEMYEALHRFYNVEFARAEDLM